MHPTRINARRRPRNHDRQTHLERCAVSLAVTRGVNRSSMEFDEVTGDPEAQSEARVLACRAAVSLPKPLEYMRKEIGFDSDPRVADGDFDVRVDPLESYLYSSLFGCEFHRIGDQIPDDLLQAVGVAGDRGRRVDHRLYSNVLGIGGRPNCLHRLLDHGWQVDRLDIQAKFPGHDAGYIQHVLDNLAQHRGIALDRLERPGLFFRR